MKTENLLLLIGAFLLFKYKKGSAIGFASENEFISFAKRKHVKEFAKAYINQEKRIKRFAEKIEMLRDDDNHTEANKLDKLNDKERQKLDLMVLAESDYYKVEPYYFIEAVNYHS